MHQQANTKRRITYIQQHFAEPTSGGGTRPFEFARRLARSGHEVTVIAGGSESASYKTADFTVIRVRAPYANQMGFARRLLSFAQFMVSSTWVAARKPADVVLASSTPLTVAIPGAIAANRQRCRFVLEVRDVWPEVPLALGYLDNPLLRFAAMRLERWAYARADQIVALSPGMAQSVLKVAPDRPISTVPNGCDFETFYRDGDREFARSELGVSRDQRLIVYAGSLGKIYTIPWLIQLAARVEEAGIEFRVYGDGASKPDSIALARDLGLDADKIFRGTRPKNVIADAFFASDATISPVLDEPALYPASINKVFDSMAAQRPVLFNSPGWLAQLMQSRGAGWVLPMDLEAAASQLIAIVQSDHSVEIAGQNAAAIGHEMFDRDDQYAEFARALLSPPGQQ